MSKERDDFQKTLHGIAAGSGAAVRHFIETYGRHVQRVVRRRLGPQMRSKFDSADFVQMVWASFFRNPARVHSVASPKELLTYLTVMARNKVIDQARRRKTAEACGLDPNPGSSHPMHGGAGVDVLDTSTPSQYAIANERWQRIMSDPSERNRRIIQMRMQGASFAEIALRLKIGETTVRTILQKMTGANS